MKWFYYGYNGKRVGPFGDDEFKRLAQTGVILPSTTVENENGQRALAERVAGLFPSKAEGAREWETRFQKLTETVVEGRSVVDGKIDDLSRRLGGVAQTNGDLARRLSELETSSKESRNAWIWRTDELEERFAKGNADLTERADVVEKRLDEKSDDWARQMRTLEKRLSDGSAELTKRVGDLDVRLIGTANLAQRVNALERKDVPGDLTKRLDALETSVGGARSGLTKRVAELEKKGDASGDLTKRLDALETSVGGARSGLTKRVEELEKKSAGGDLAKRLDAIESRENASAGLATRLAAVEKSSGAKVGALAKRVEELESRASANADWTKRLDWTTCRLETAGNALAKRLNAIETRDAETDKLTRRVAALEDAEGNGEIARRLEAVEKRENASAGLATRLAAVEKSSDAKVGALAKRVEELESRASANVDWTKRLERRLETNDGVKLTAALERLSETLAAFDVRLERLTERLDALERRVDENKPTGREDDELILEDDFFDDFDGEPTEESKRYSSAENRTETAAAQAVGKDRGGEQFNSENCLVGQRFDAGNYLVGVDLPAGKYRAEIWRNWASVEVTLGENYRCYVLEIGNGVVDGYESFAIVDLPEGATVTLDNPVDFTFLTR